ncbi:hypothetical protein DKM44_10860 [Deinococcus irradiatisoli]|uniref:Translocation/assembly module TamB n=1 Tax=Deinococcus irradiatisoli TaxID=2202254 RepID=A0A2Z3JI31_9DEIO|nr:hypothetical protein [Deinococcus irradiatisoli]AWN23666.1 hypothetical protein DKM44_10860 [Deinococcus irradiatisoli]
MILRRAALFLIILVVAAALLLAFGPALYLPAVLARLSGPYQVTVGGVSGPLWQLSLRRLGVTGPGLNVTVERARVGLAGLDLLHRTVRLNVALSGGAAKVKLGDLLKSFGKSTSAAGFKVLPGTLAIENVNLDLDGQGVDIPNGRFTVSGGSTSPQGGQLQLEGQTAFGDAHAGLTYREQNGQLSAKVDFDADARLINAYWKPGGVTAGRISGQYRLGTGPVEGDFKLSGGALKVPQAKFAEVGEIGGRFTQRGTRIQGQLSGQGLGGPVTAQASVDLKARQFRVTAQASPTFAALGEALKVPASGAARLSVQASGWTAVQVRAELSSAQGEVNTVPYSGLNARYDFQSARQGTVVQILANTLKFQVGTELLKERQQLSGQWTFNKSGALTLSGNLANKPLDLAAKIDAANTLTVQGQALGGPVQGQYQLGSGELSASLRPDIFDLSGEISAAGTVNDLALSADQLKVGPLTFSGQGQLDAEGLHASLDEAAGGQLTLNTNRRFAGSWQVEELKLSGVTASGSGSIDLKKGLSGTASAQLPQVSSTLSGPLALNWLTRTGSWQAGNQRLVWDNTTFRLTANNLKAAGLTLSGQASYRSDLRQATVDLQTDLLGESQRITGVWTPGQQGQLKVTGQLLDAPLTLNAQLDAQNILRLQGQALHGPVQAQVRLSDQHFTAQLQPTLSGVSAQLSASGTPSDVAFSVRQLQAGTFTLDGSGHYRQGQLQASLTSSAGGVLGVQGTPSDLAFQARNVALGPLTLSAQGQFDQTGLRASVTEAQGGTLSLTTNPQFVGSWRADHLTLSGVTASGSGSIDLKKGLSGTASATLPQVSSTLSGPLALNWLTRTGSWQAGNQRLVWDNTTFRLTANNLKAAGLTLSGQASYRSDLRQATVDLQTDLLGESQRITGVWTPGQQGQLKVTGQLLDAPLTLNAQLDAQNILRLQGQALHGPVQAQVRLSDQHFTAQLQPTLSGVSAQLSASGTPSDVAFSVRQLQAGTFTLDGSGHYRQGQLQASLTSSAGGVLGVQGTPSDLAFQARNVTLGPLTLSAQGQFDQTGLRASVTEAQGGTLSLTTNPQFVGSWRADHLTLSGVTASGSGSIDLKKGLSGTATAQLPQVSSTLSGPLALNWLTRTGSWQAGNQRLVWDNTTFRLTANNLKAAGLTLSGQASYRSDLRQATVDLQTDLLGESQRITGVWTPGQQGQLKVTGQLLDAPLTLNAQLDAQNILRLQGQALHGPVQAQVRLSDQHFTAQLQPTLSGVSAQLSASGTPSDVAFSVRQLQAGTFTLDGSGHYRQGQLQASLTSSAGGVLGVQGTPSDLAFQARNVALGPLTLSAQGQFDQTGLRASVTEAQGGTLSLTTNPQFVGSWRADHLTLSGVTASGSGSIDLKKGLSGTASATLPQVSSTLSGPLALNWLTRTGSWQAGDQRLTWDDNTFRLTANDLKAQDFTLNGQLAYRLSDQAITGQLTASGDGIDVVATGQGQQASLRGTVRGIQVRATTDLHAPFITQASVDGSDISGTLSVNDGLTFRLRTGTRTAQGHLNGQQWTVSGGLDLAALKPLLGSAAPQDLSGNVQFDLSGLGGTAQVQAHAAGSDLHGTLTRQGGQVAAELRGEFSDLSAQLSGQIYPQVQLSGLAVWRGAGGPQTLQAQVSGPYSNLKVQAQGATSAIDTGGLALPGQAVRLRGTLTPTLALNGSWGELGLTYRDGEVEASGRQTLSAAGQTGQVQVAATWRPDYSGALNAAGQLGDYTFSASGPWTALQVNLSGAGLTASGRANARTLDYRLDVNGAVSGLNVKGEVRGHAAQLSGTLQASDAQGGRADIKVNSLTSFTLDAQNFKVAGQTLQGRLEAEDGLVSGSAQLGPLTVQARNGQFTASGTLYEHTLQASGTLKLPSTLTNLQLALDGPYLSAQASGSGQALSGTLRVKAQSYTFNGVRAQLPSQLLPLSASLSPLSIKVGELRYAGGGWSGAANLRYLLAGQPGSLQLLGDGQTLSAAPQGSLSGKVTLLPALGGTLQLALAPLEAALPATLLPEQVKTNLVPGVLNVTLAPQSAQISLSGSRWQGDVLGLSGEINFAGQLSAAGVLTLPDSRLPLRYFNQDLRLTNAVLSAHALQPFLGSAGDLGGEVRADLQVPGLKFGEASGQAQINLSLGAQAARGRITLRQGQLGGTLSSDLGGQTLRLSGDLYPAANATFAFGGLSGTIRGDAASAARPDRWTAQASGTFQGRSVDASATLSPQIATLSGVVDGLKLELSARQDKGAWAVLGNFNAADLRPLTGQAGQVAGTLSGTFSRLIAQASGTLAGAAFELPATYQNGQLSLGNAALSYPLPEGQATARISGQLYPALNLSGSATLSSYAPGTYRLSASGSYSAPRVVLAGTLQSGVLGLDLAGTQLQAVLSGKAFEVTAQGERLSGEANGRTDLPQYLQSAQLTVHAPYRNGDTRLQLDGPLAWNATSGWTGTRLQVAGQAPGGALDAQLSGPGPLALRGSLGPATLSGEFPASLPTTPGGTLRLSALDLGAFWQRPHLLSVSGQAQLGGASWAALSAEFSGALNDADGQLSGPFSGAYAAGQARLSLKGQALQVQAQLDGPTFAAQLQASGVTLSRLLPPALGVNSLRLSGKLDAAGSTSAGLERLEAADLQLSGQQRDIGGFGVTGTARYGGGVAQADLRAQAYGGELTAVGSFQNGLNITASGIDLSRFGLSAVGGQIRLQGEYANPLVSGTLHAERPEGVATATLSGPLRDLGVHLQAKLRGAYSGTLDADASQLDWQRLSAQLHVYGNAAQGGNTVKLDLRGVWPQLSGEARAQLAGLKALGVDQPVVLSGRGDGHYDLDLGALGSGELSLTGLNPTVQASATLQPLPLLGADGQGQLNASLSGPLSSLKLAVSGSFTDLSRSGVRLPLTSISFGGPLTALSGEVRQGGEVVATLRGDTLNFSGVQAEAGGSALRASGFATIGGKLSAQLQASGALGGSAKLRYEAGELAASGDLRASGFGASFSVAASQGSGWNGSVLLGGGPEISGVGPVLERNTRLKLSGPFDAPQLTGTLALVGAQADLSASLKGARLTLRDGNSTQASGALSLVRSSSGYVWAGSSRLVRPEGELGFSLTGPLTNPTADLKFRRGQWTAQGQGNLGGAALTLSDGVHQGQLTYDGQTLNFDAPQLDLAGLNLGTLSGRVSAVGSLSSDLSGSASLSFTDLSSGATLPYFDLPLQGSGTAEVKLVKGVGQASAHISAPYGEVSLSAQQTAAGSGWTGRLQGQLQKGEGRIVADVTLDQTGAGGQLTLQNLPLNVSNVSAALSGTVQLSGQTFTLSGEAVSGMGRAEVSGDGALADLVPALSGFTVLRPSETGYRVQVGVSSFDLAQLKLGSGLGGSLSGQLTLSQSSGSFVVRSAALKLGDASFPARIDGTLAGGDWRLRGYVGNSALFGAVTNGQLSVRAQLEALPVGNIIAGFTGKLPGNGVVTGLARIDAPLSDPLSGSLNLVAERVRITAGQDTLIGSGTLDFRNRELRGLNLTLDGAGQWQVAGQFTRQKVDLQAAFINTTFTPVLAFIPSLSDLSPALKGSLTLSVGGSYAQPTASLSGSNLVGSVAGLNVTLPSLRAQLSNAGQFTGQATVQASGSASGNGTLVASGALSGNKLGGASLRYQGSLSADALGNLGNVSATLSQAQNTWTLDAEAQQGGTLSLSGQVSPRFDLKATARNYNLPIRSIYARESSLNGTLSAVSAGEQILVGGSLTFDRLVLGRLNASSLPGTASTATSSDSVSNYVSPLPDELTVFPSETGEKPLSPFLQRIVLQDIPITAPNGIRVDETLAQAELSAALTLSGSGASPRLSGAVRSLRGNLLLRDNNFNLQQAQATFDGSSLYPVFSLTAQGQVADQGGKLIGVQLQADGSFVVQSGVRALKLDTQLSCTTCASAGEYSQAELYSLLALGTPDITTLGSNIGSLGQSAISTALNVFVLGELQRNIARALGVDVFRISSNLITPEGNLDAKFTVGTYLSKEFYVQYQVDLTGKGLFDATYTTPDNRFTFRVSTPISGLDLQSVRPSLSVGYNVNRRSSVTFGVQSGSSTKFSVGYLYKW